MCLLKRMIQDGAIVKKFQCDVDAQSNEKYSCKAVVKVEYKGGVYTFKTAEFISYTYVVGFEDVYRLVFLEGVLLEKNGAEDPTEINLFGNTKTKYFIAKWHIMELGHMVYLHRKGWFNELDGGTLLSEVGRMTRSYGKYGMTDNLHAELKYNGFEAIVKL